MTDMRRRRDYYLGNFAHLFGYTPADIDALNVTDFERLADWCDSYDKAMREGSGG